MLQSLHIQNLLLIKKLDVQFGAGLNILSGESGAGKSLVLYGIALLMGARFDRSMLRGEQKQATISGVWRCDAGHGIFATLAEMGIEADPDEAIVVRRILGSSAAVYVNDSPISLKGLTHLSSFCAEMYGQFAAHRLSEVEYQRQLLDDYAGLSVDVQLSQQCHQAWCQAKLALQTVTVRFDELQEQSSYVAHTLAELQELNLKAGEIEDLQDSRREIRQSAARVEQLQKASQMLQGLKRQGIARDIDQVQAVLTDVDDDDQIAEVIDSLERARIEVTESERSIDGLLHQYGDENSSLEEIEARLFRISELARKHQTTPEQLLAVLDGLVAQSDELEALSSEQQRLGVQVDEAFRAMAQVHKALSLARQKASASFAAEVSREFAALNMPNAALQLQLIDLDGPSATGAERVQIVMRTQPDADWRPVLKIASGGEMTRVLLAIALCLGAVEHTDLASRLPLMFDEIDAGMGGETAALLGLRMKNLAQSRQVLAVTHSPQMAASASHHFGVKKHQEGDRICTAVSVLDGDMRREEIARMLAGAIITPAARAAADALLQGN